MFITIILPRFKCYLNKRNIRSIHQEKKLSPESFQCLFAPQTLSWRCNSLPTGDLTIASTLVPHHVSFNWEDKNTSQTAEGRNNTSTSTRALSLQQSSNLSTQATACSEGLLYSSGCLSSMRLDTMNAIGKERYCDGIPSLHMSHVPSMSWLIQTQ